jgi:hypothetical protein
MMDQLQLDERAADAKAILNHPLVTACFDALERRAFETAVNTTDMENIMLALQDLRALRALRAELQTVVSDASVARRRRTN